MSSFSCDVVKVSITPHPHADSLEIAEVGRYRSVVRIGDFISGDLAVYIPESAIVPIPILAQIGLEGKLAGPNKNRVKAAKILGVLSQGILYPIKSGVLRIPGATRIVSLGEDVSAFMGIKKYIPEIPMGMSGEIVNLGPSIFPSFEIENIKKYGNVLKDGEYITITEKIHGTFCGVGIMPFEHPDLIKGRIAVFSKFSTKSGANSLAFKDNKINSNNLYLSTVKSFGIDRYLLNEYDGLSKPLFIFGEIYGKKVQDLSYNEPTPVFRAFDGVYGDRNSHTFHSEFLHGLPTVPHLYTGLYDPYIIESLTNSDSTITQDHIREGVVIRAYPERTDPLIGRVILKSVSERYLCRKGGTEIE